MLEYRRQLPHFQPDNKYIFLTWRLWGSLPCHLACSTVSLTPGQAFAAVDRALHSSSSGPLWLKNERIASMLADTLEIGEKERFLYELCAWVIMPNHVHLLFLPEAAVPVITRWLKGSTARRANEILGRMGQPFWQDESYDHWVRHQREFDRIVRYIEKNPVSAGLVSSIELWPWSSAARWGRPLACPPRRLKPAPPSSS